MTKSELVKTLSNALGDDRLAQVSDEEKLLRSGIISSIEWVTILAELEKELGQSISDVALDAPNATLSQLLAVLNAGDASGGGPAPAPASHSFLFQSLKRSVRRPLFSIPLVGVWILLLSFLVGEICQRNLKVQYDKFVEHGARFYPNGRFSQDDFKFALQFHALNTPAAPGQETILVFGDSGTYGTWLEPQESITAFTERALGQSKNARVLNMSWYGQLFAQQLMLLELAWEKPFSTVVFTIGSHYLSSSLVEIWTHKVRHTPLNYPILESFMDRIPEPERAPFQSVLTELKEADTKGWGPLWRLAYKYLPILHYRPFLQHLWYDGLLPKFVNSGYRFDRKEARQWRVFDHDSPPKLYDGIPAEDLDGRQVAMIRSAITLLKRRGVKTILYIQPSGPESLRPGAIGPHSVVDIAQELARETGCGIVDMSWKLSTADFTDSVAHYSVSGNEKIGSRIAAVIRGERGY